ncbi:hypothetical protein [Zooshikella harenae]|uniref:Solute-binding protein family 3/N-terminal domain-containing protein n=1 Tax=Zooshikella harenae TaxID=2827238 RepID=A0ABS5ZAM9_9GAMM|nr:hypothetical protein [Zooshikella harenae]MBU2711114.1 hypothetical protein [Zooshikella harenae]
MKDLEDITIGGVLAASYTWFDQAVKNGVHLKMERVPLDKMNFDKLLNERIPVTTMDLNLGLYLLNIHFNKLARNKITYHPKIITTYVYHMLLSKKNKQNIHRVKVFNKGLSLLRKKGKVEQFILKSHQGDYLLKGKQ